MAVNVAEAGADVPEGMKASIGYAPGGTGGMNGTVSITEKAPVGEVTTL